MSRDEYLNCHLLLGYTHKSAPEEAIRFYRAAERQLDNYRAHFGQFGQFVRNLPHCYRRLCEGDNLNWPGDNGRWWLGKATRPEHVSLYNEQARLFVAGDQLLPTISSNISVWPTEPYANPLKEWLDSCHRLIDLLPDDVLILPHTANRFMAGGHVCNSQIQEIEDNSGKTAAVLRARSRAGRWIPSRCCSTVKSLPAT
ncbi:MAG: hypothetical protein R3E95_04705 [Thiolinea sp.]